MSLQLRILQRVASKSKHRRYHHSAIVFSGSKLLSFGYNVDGTHAEVMAIRRFQRLYKRGKDRTSIPTNLHLVSFMQYSRTSNPGNSCPCPNCFNAILNAGIKKVTYFNLRGEPCQLTLNLISKVSSVK
jgi:deoxycytidylate deaminase